MISSSQTPNTNHCSQHLSTLTAFCEQLNIFLAQDKQEGPTTLLEYLGILLDSSALEARLLKDKPNDIKSSLAKWFLRTHCTIQELLSLIGTLSFTAKIVPAGRTFLRRMIDLSTSAPHLHDKITLSKGFSLDI